MNQFIFKSGFCDLCLCRQVYITIIQYIPPLNIKNLRKDSNNLLAHMFFENYEATVVLSNQVLQCQSSTAVRLICPTILSLR